MKAIRSLEQHVDSLMSYDYSYLSGEDLLEEVKESVEDSTVLEGVFSKQQLPEDLIRIYDRAGCFQAIYQKEKKQEQTFYRPWKTFFQT